VDDCRPRRGEVSISYLSACTATAAERSPESGLDATDALWRSMFFYTLALLNKMTIVARLAANVVNSEPHHGESAGVDRQMKRSHSW
jgi:hypothetical protein